MEKTVAKIEYCVPPLIVEDLITQCAVHFLVSFRSMSEEHIKDVIRCGLRGSGGLKEEVAYWIDNCIDDAEHPKNSAGWWALEELGPWVFYGVSPSDVALAVWRHTRGWKAKEFTSYGWTLADAADLNGTIAQMASNFTDSRPVP